MDYLEIPHRIDFFSIIVLLGVAQGVFLALLLIKKKSGLDLIDRVLGFFLLVHSLFLVEILLCYSGFITNVLWLVDFSEPFNFMIGPLTWLVYHTYVHNRLPTKLIWHFLPFILYSLYAVFFFIQPETFKLNAYLDAYHPTITPVNSAEFLKADPLGIKRQVNVLAIIHNAIYWSIIIYSFAKEVGQNGFFNKSRTKLSWMFLLFCLAFLSYLHWTFRTLAGFRDLQDHLGAAIDTFIIYFVGFKIFNKLLSQGRIRTNKYSKSSLSRELRERILYRLNAVRSEDDFFLDPDLTLASLAGRIKVSTHHLSQALNEGLGVSFLDHINELRVCYAKKLLIERLHYKIDEIAELSGFNSRSSFYAVFKKFTRMTPSEYRKSRDQGIASQ